MKRLWAKIPPAFWGLAAGLATLFACSSLPAFSIRFDQVNGLKPGDPLVSSRQVIGQVKEITYTRDADFLVAVEIRKEFLSLATEDSRFFIGDSPLDAAGKAVLLVQEKPGGKPIAPQALIQGSPDPGEQAADALAKLLEGAFFSLIRELETFQESREYETLKKKLSELEARLRSSGKEMGKTLREQILPDLEKKLREIIKELEEKGHPDKARELENEVQKLQDV